MLPSPKLKSAGFSLVEIALAIGIIAFAFVALMGLLPAGLTTFRRALDTSICSQIAQRIVSEAQQQDFNVLTDRDNLPAYTAGQEYSFRMVRPGTTEVAIRYFDEQGVEIIPKSGTTPSADEMLRVIYWVNARVIPRVALPTGSEGFPVSVKAKQMGNLALVTVQVARNPSGVELPVHSGNASDPTDGERNLWAQRPGIDIFTYSSYIGRNL